ncbi:MAG: nucleotidyl transferase AbiEii/AbiGii toxin family protein [Campylobacterota bacterium]|nr:nucleotidyl transferase AbiEii/AbiGii toxin family protein [Campylobacterota bacterium]
MLEKTKKVLDKLSKDKLFANNDIRFVGGTALSYYINHRLSEDLDFATIDLNKELIDTAMLSYGATKIEHNNNMTDSATNDGFNLEDSYIVYMLDDVKVDFFEPPFNLFEEKVWKDDKFTKYNNTELKVMSLDGVIYLKMMAFWNRKKYRDIYDIYFILENKISTTNKLLTKYIEYNISYTKKDLVDKISSKNEFYEKYGDEGINTLVQNPNPYEWYRNKIEEFFYDSYLEDLYK